jgi:hypothetical protein
MRGDLSLVLARLPLFEFQLPNDRRARPTPLHSVAERLQMAFVILPVERKVVWVSECEGERHRILFHFCQQFQHPPTRSRGELDNFTTRTTPTRVSCRHIPTEADLDQAGPTVTGHASLSLSRRNMRFRQASSSKGISPLSFPVLSFGLLKAGGPSRMPTRERFHLRRAYGGTGRPDKCLVVKSLDSSVRPMCPSQHGIHRHHPQGVEGRESSPLLGCHVVFRCREPEKT